MEGWGSPFYSEKSLENFEKTGHPRPNVNTCEYTLQHPPLCVYLHLCAFLCKSLQLMFSYVVGQVVSKEAGMRQRIPVRCILCTSVKQRNGKIFDLVTTKQGTAMHFIRQHLETQQHVRLLVEREACQSRSLLREALQTPCTGMALNDESIGIMHQYAHHVGLWLAWRSACPEVQKHSYTYSQHADGIELRHTECTRVCTPVLGRRDMCDHCAGLDLRRCILKCVLKKFGAEVLFAKLFETSERLQCIIAAMKEDVIYRRHSRQVDKLLSLQVHELQQWTRASFLSIRSDKRNPVLQSFMNSVITPVLQINVTAVLNQKPELLTVQSHFERFLDNPQMEEMDRINVAVAKASLTGRLQNHPLIQGLLLTCLRVLEREESGSTTTKGRVAKTSAIPQAQQRSWHETLARCWLWQAGTPVFYLCLVQM